MSNESKAQELISVFLCEKDTDIEYFLKNRAILFEKLGKSRTFFIYDEDNVSRCNLWNRNHGILFSQNS